MQEFSSTLPVKQLDAAHPFYSEVLDSWNQLATLNCGGYKIELEFTNLLRKRPQELGEVLQMRKAAASYTNLLGNITGWYDSALWQQQPNFDVTGETGEVKSFRESWEADVTRTRISFRRFFKGIAESMLVNKFAYVLIDQPTPKWQIANRAQQDAQRLVDPFLIEYKPQNVVNWGEDEFGALNWAVIKTQESESVFAQDPIKRDVWTYYDTQQVARYTRLLTGDSVPDFATLDVDYPRSHCLSAVNRIPLYRFSVPDGLWFGNRVRLPLLNHFNLDNALDWGLSNSCLAQLYVKGRYGGASIGIEKVTVSEVGYHQLDENGEMGYIEPEGTAYDASQKRLDNIEERIYKACYLQSQARTNKSTPTQQSGISKIQDLMPANDALSGIGDVMRPALQLIYGDVLYVRFPTATPTINVRGFEFNDKAVGKIELIDAASVVEVNSPTYEREIAKEIVHVVFPDRPPNWYTTVEGEIDANPTPLEQQQQQQDAANEAKVSTALKFQTKLDALAPAV